MELLDLYNAQGEKLNKTIERGNKNIPDGEYFKLTTIWIKSKGKFLIQKASVEKGGEYAVSGGHVTAGSTSREHATVELREELGIDVNPNDLKFMGNIIAKHAIFDVYFYEDENLINKNFVLQESEVESVDWLTTSQIKKLIKDEKFRKSSEKQFNQFFA